MDRDPRIPGWPSGWGELVLVMQAPWVIIDQVPGERPHDQVGVHGGVSAAEMQIPLIFSSRLDLIRSRQ